MATPIHDLLLPAPHRMALHIGTAVVGANSAIDSRVEDSRLKSAILRWRDSIAPNSKAAVFRMAIDSREVPHTQGYCLSIHPDSIELLGGSAAGCFHGLQTLQQIAAKNPERVPCCRIDDQPDFETRGLLHDVTRGKVPALATLKDLVDRLAQWKVNQLQLYIEHAFVFSFDSEICGPDDGLTPDEVRELDAYCRERFMELVPAVATLGHMGRILSLSRYRHLAELETAKSWAEMTWPERARGFTLDCMNPESHRLVERMWREVLDAFTSTTVNICGDEPWDLGAGKNKERFEKGGKAEAYLEHLRRTQRICTWRGRSVQFWSDVITHYPHLLDSELKQGAVLHWGYDDKANYEGTGTFTAAGAKTFVCPGTSGWKRIINSMDLAERNIAAFADAGRRHGAAGLLNTDWGDHGHFNALACSWHGMALGAALGWNAGQRLGLDFDRRFAQAILGTDDTSLIEALRTASRPAERTETWRLLWLPAEQAAQDPSLPTPESLVEARKAAQSALRLLDGLSSPQNPPSVDVAEWMLSSRFFELFCERCDFLQAQNSRHSRIVEWGERVNKAADDYADSWRRRNKPSGLVDIVRALQAVSKPAE